DAHRSPPLPTRRSSDLRLIAQTGSHRHHFDRAACSERGILVCVAPGGAKAYSTSELTWALILAAVRHLPYEVEQMKRGCWNTTRSEEHTSELQSRENLV